MPHPLAPKEFVAGADEIPSIDAGILSTNWEEGQARRAPPERDYSQVDDRPAVIRERCRTGATLLTHPV